MKTLDTQKMQAIEGGALNWGLLGGLAAIITFLAGLFDGQIKLKWQNRKNIEFKGNSEGKPLIQIRRKD